MADDKNEFDIATGHVVEDDRPRLSGESDRSVASGDNASAHRVASADGVNADTSLADAVDESKKGRFAYFRTKQFYLVLFLG